MSLPHEGAKASRNYDKCHRCRDDHKKCARQSLSSSCERCIRLGHTCSPPIKARTVGRPRATIDLDSGIKKLGQSPATLDYHLPASFTTNWLLGRTVEFGRGSYALAVNAAAQRLLTRCRRDLDVCLTFQPPPHNDLVRSTSENSWVRADYLDRLISLLQERQLFGHQELWSRREDTHRPSDADILFSVDHKSGNFKVLLCSANVLNQNHNRECVDDFSVDYYESTEIALNHLLDSIRTHEQTPIQHPSRPFPASHIAYMNMDREAAFKLWAKCTSSSRSEVDILGRTFPHLLAEASDSDLLGRMDASLLRDAELDTREFSLLDLAIIGNSENTVKTIIKKEIACPPFTPAMQEAICMKRPEIANILGLSRLESTHFTESYEMDVSEDLAGMNEHLVQAQPRCFNCQDMMPLDASYDLDEFNYDFVDPSIYGSECLPQYTPLCPPAFDLSTLQASESVMCSPYEESPFDYNSSTSYHTAFEGHDSECYDLVPAYPPAYPII